MPITVTCPACDKKASVPDDAGGKTARCPACKSVFQVPPSAVPIGRPAVHGFWRFWIIAGLFLGGSAMLIVAVANQGSHESVGKHPATESKPHVHSKMLTTMQVREQLDVLDGKEVEVIGFVNQMTDNQIGSYMVLDALHKGQWQLVCLLKEPPICRVNDMVIVRGLVARAELPEGPVAALKNCALLSAKNIDKP